MNLNIKKFTAGIIVLAITVFTLSYAAFASYKIKILVNGEELSYRFAPFIKDETVFVPIYDVFEALGIRSGLDNKKTMLPLSDVAQSTGCSVIWSHNNDTVSISSRSLMKVYFFDCGQADSIFAELPDGKCMLVDSGESAFSAELESNIRALGYSHIDYLVATHPHSDHIGSMAHILDKFSVGKFYMPSVTHNTKTFEDMLEALLINGCEREYISRGSSIADSIYSIKVLSPEKEKQYERMNDYSAVIKLSYDDISIMLSADAEAPAEEDMVNSDLELEADILKIGHHGSVTSTTQSYLDEISPMDAVISTGKDATYRFPSPFVMALLQSREINIHRTDIKGTITAITDGYIYIIDNELSA